MRRNVSALILLAVACVLLLMFLGSRQRAGDVTMAAKSSPVLTGSPASPVTAGQPVHATVSGQESSPHAPTRPLPLEPESDSHPEGSGSADGPVPFSRELADLDRIIGGVQLTDSSDLTRMYLLARRVDPVLLSGYISSKLRNQDISQGERYNAIWIATKTNSPAMLPVWQGLLVREYPATARELKSWRGWMKQHRNESLRLMQAEQLRAISMIGALQESSPESQEYLFNFAKNGLDIPGDVVLLRFEAARAIHEYNRNGLLRLSAALQAKDPLRAQLGELAKIRRGDQ